MIFSAPSLAPTLRRSTRKRAHVQYSETDTKGKLRAPDESTTAELSSDEEED
ncbi:hypothetical protein Esi_0032_0113 [Ectocarpus siliculosus]|uniref:Uncharacterized protein n=1 Tax=Ectocarpus siliculosus TaxID=2880 RepID=D7FX54_ECTSI|nr:hypothetical protein Esi_0032_0113 [Ectocarpus siliculosus]|eukprot:CBJ26387.1 hypothetical protein Esi_0032_0113 [Ectocarpus siliculosus]